MAPAGGSYQFGPFRLDTRRHVLLRGDKVISLTPRAYDLLVALVARSGSLVSKSELMTTVWRDTAVEENNLNQAISAVRKALGDGRNGARYIETVPRLGYRFTSAVHISDADVLPATEPSRRRKAGLATLIAVVAASAMIGVRERTPLANASAARSLAVLPFITVGAPSEPYVGVGMADALITRIGNLEDIAVRPTSAIDEYGGTGRDAIAAGRQLQVDAVLDGRIQRSNDRLRVTAQLIDVRSGGTLWSGVFDEPSKEIFALQDAIAERLANTLVPHLTAETKERLGRSRQRNVVAYDHYVRGRFLWNMRSREGLQRSLEAFQKALETEPTFAEAYVGLADCYNLMPEHGLAPSHEAMPRAKAAALQALEIDPGLGEAHASLAYTLANYDFDLAAAEAAFRRAIDLTPSYATAHQWYAELLVARGRPAEALASYRRAQELDPLSPIISALVEYTYAELGEHQRAADGLLGVVDLHPGFGMAYEFLTDVYLCQRRFPEALAAIEQARRLNGESLEETARLKAAYERGGAQAFWRHRLAAAMKQPHPLPYVVALYHAQLGERDRALEWLERAYAERDRFLIFVGADHRFAPLAGDPRFEQFRRRVGI